MLLADVLTCFAKSSCADAESFSASTLCRFARAGDLAVGKVATP
jgi:hypothetical protein